jgi:hypothetical protein
MSLKKLKITKDQLSELVRSLKIVKRYYDNTYLRSDVESIYKENKS